MFEPLMTFLAILAFGFPAVPWFGARWGVRGVWVSAGLSVLILLCLFPILFDVACDADNCGQGAIAIFVLGPIWIVAALLTIMSAALAHYKIALNRPKQRIVGGAAGRVRKPSNSP